jgi:hypothetical protein
VKNEGSEETAGDAGEAVVFCGEPHALDEGFGIGHGEAGIICTFSIN